MWCEAAVAVAVVTARVAKKTLKWNNKSLKYLQYESHISQSVCNNRLCEEVLFLLNIRRRWIREAQKRTNTHRQIDTRVLGKVYVCEAVRGGKRCETECVAKIVEVNNNSNNSNNRRHETNKKDICICIWMYTVQVSVLQTLTHTHTALILSTKLYGFIKIELKYVFKVINSR